MKCSDILCEVDDDTDNLVREALEHREELAQARKRLSLHQEIEEAKQGLRSAIEAERPNCDTDAEMAHILRQIYDEGVTQLDELELTDGTPATEAPDALRRAIMRVLESVAAAGAPRVPMVSAMLQTRTAVGRAAVSASIQSASAVATACGTATKWWP